MILLTMLTALAGAPGPGMVTNAKETVIVDNEPEEIYVADVVLDDKTGKIKNEVVNTLVAGAIAQYAHHYFSIGDYEPIVLDKYSPLDEECEYSKDPFLCTRDNDQWIVTTNVHMTNDMLTISMRIYDPSGRLRASSADNKVIQTICRQPPRRRVPHPTQGSVPYDPPEECKDVNPRLLSSTLRQSTKILLSNVRP